MGHPRQRFLGSWSTKKRYDMLGCYVFCFDDVPLVEFMHFVFIRMSGERYRRPLRSLLLYLCDVFQSLINPMVCCFWFWSFENDICLSTVVFRHSAFYVAEDETTKTKTCTIVRDSPLRHAAAVCRCWRRLLRSRWTSGWRRTR